MSEELKNYRVFEVSHLWSTNTVKIKDVHSRDVNSSVILKYDCRICCILKQSIAYLNARSIPVSGQSGSYKNKFLLLSDSWGPNYIDLVEKPKPKKEFSK